MDDEKGEPKLYSCNRCKHLGTERFKCTKCKAFQSPFSENPDSWLLLPDRWLGEHATRYSAVMSEIDGSKGVVMANFAAAMALMEDWSLPGLEGNPKNWNFNEIDLQIIAWVNYHVITNGFLDCFNVRTDF